MWLLTEDGLYEVLMQSRKPIAKQFKKEVKEILKSIRKSGAYLTKEKINELVNNPDLLIDFAMQLKQMWTEQEYMKEEIKVQAQLIGEIRPKAN